MCPDSCIAYTGPFAALDRCPKCQLPRYENVKGKRKPVKQYYTIPLGPMLQALWRTPEGADRMRYRNHKTNKIMQQLNQNHGVIPIYEGVFHGLEYINAVLAGKIHPNDTLIFFSLDGAQLYRDKQSDCVFAIWVILNLNPEIRYKKKYVLPACFIPGPNNPDNTESFLLPSFRHVSALQKKGLKVWDGRQQKLVVTRPFFCFGTADTVALPILNGLVGHNGSAGCRIYCGMRGRHKPNQPMYYPAALKPNNYTVKGSDQEFK